MSEYGIMMPFVVCKSEGGPYDDDSFTAGYECGLLDHLLSHGPISYQCYIRVGNVPQADLIAMRHGFTMSSEPWEDCPEEWSLAKFHKTVG